MEQRTVQHLRLRATQAADARAMLPLLQDALRCASLPDAGARVLLVRRLVLGRVSKRMGPQALSRLMEQRVAEAGLQWADGGEPQADAADAVAFASPLHARIAASLRLLRGQALQAWYWPLAVPECLPGAGVVAQLDAVLARLASPPQAPAALQAWAQAVQAAGLGEQAQALVAQQRVRLLLQAAALPEAAAPTKPSSAGVTQGAALSALPALPNVVRAAVATPLLAQAEAAQARMWVRQLATRGQGAAPSPVVASVPDPAFADEVSAASAGLVLKQATPVLGLQGLGAQARPEVEHRPTTPGAVPQAQPGHAIAHSAQPLATSAASPAGAPLHGEPTAAAGLLFLLPVLAQLGLAASEARPADTQALALALLQQACQRLQLAEADPMHALFLAVPPAQLSAQALAAAATLLALRRWLRRMGRIGLHSLVCRRGLVAITPTHVDVYFDLAAADVRVRRLGLDITPGWLPWFGRVVAFHYQNIERT